MSPHQPNDGAVTGIRVARRFLRKDYMDLHIGDRVHGVSENCEYTGTVMYITTNSAKIHRDGLISDNWICDKREDGGWGSDCRSGCLTIINSTSNMTLNPGDRVYGEYSGIHYVATVISVGPYSASLRRDDQTSGQWGVTKIGIRWGANGSDGVLINISNFANTLIKPVTNTQGGTMQSLKEKLIQSQLSEPEKTFRANGVTDSCGNLTAEGGPLFTMFLLKKFGNEFKTTIDNLAEKPETAEGK